MVDRLSLRLVPDELWALVEPLIPGFKPRPQGGGTAPLPARAVFTAIVYVLTSGCAWRDLPPSFGVTLVRADAASYCLQTGVGGSAQHFSGPGGASAAGSC